MSLFHDNWDRAPARPHGWYDTALVCGAGHVINRSSQMFPAQNAKHCDKCGQPALQACAQCETPIRGEYHVGGVSAIGFDWTPPAHCYECGAPHAWTTAALEAAEELADSVSDELTPEEIALLKAKLPTLTSDGPATEVAAHRVRTILEKVSPTVKDVFQKTLTGVLTKAATATLFGA